MKRVTFLTLIMFIVFTAAVRQANGKTDQTLEKIFGLAEQIHQAVASQHYQTAQSLMTAFQKQWSSVSQNERFSKQEAESLRVLSDAVSKDLVDPGHSPLIHDTDAFMMVCNVVFEHGSPNLQLAKKQLLPFFEEGKKQLENHQGDAFAAVFNQWKLNFNAYYPVFNLTNDNDSLNRVEQDVVFLNKDMNGLNNERKLTEDLNQLQKDLEQVLSYGSRQSEYANPWETYLWSGAGLLLLILLILKLKSLRKAKPGY
jgi:sporulation protein YpjB